MSKIEKLVIATRNPAKKKRYDRIISKLDIADSILDLSNFDFQEKPVESGKSAEENAKIKALFYAKKTKLPVISEDESLFVDFLPLDKQPGTNVRRVSGRELNDDELFAYWGEIIARVASEKRTGKWHVAICLARPDKTISLASYDTEILFFFPPSETRIPGWPISSLQGPVVFKKPHSELTQEEMDLYEEKIEKILKPIILKDLFNKGE